MDPDRICVYCGSSTGDSPAIVAAAAELGTVLAEHGVTVVYGGGAVGLMAVVADAALAAGGAVIGVIPSGLFEREVAHRGRTELREVASMHERKQLMFELAQGFVALPGGLGTLEELTEMATWGHLGLHAKPIVVLNCEGYFEPFLAQLHRAVARGFMQHEQLGLLRTVDRVTEVLPALRSNTAADPGRPTRHQGASRSPAHPQHR